MKSLVVERGRRRWISGSSKLVKVHVQYLPHLLLDRVLVLRQQILLLLGATLLKFDHVCLKFLDLLLLLVEQDLVEDVELSGTVLYTGAQFPRFIDVDVVG